MDRQSLEKRPSILVVGSPNVGKRTLLSRLLGQDFEDAPDPLPELFVHGWTINTKYYTADVSVQMAHLSDEISSSFPVVGRAVALVMVFDVNKLSTLSALKAWVANSDIQKFDILLCMGNKVDLVPGHPAHAEYRRRMKNHNLELSEYGISETEGSSLLGDGEDQSFEFKSLCLDWCLEHNIEYVEVCASNAGFDKCLSVDGDSQGVERLYGALSAHMWPGMLLKSGDRVNEPSLPEQEEEVSSEESDYEAEYEKLSSGSAEPWDDIGWISADGSASTSGQNLDKDNKDTEEVKSAGEENQPSTSTSAAVSKELPEEIEEEETCDNEAYEFDDLETLMSEIGNMRDGLRLMPDFQRREMAAKLAMKMATMFGDSSGGEDEDNSFDGIEDSKK